MITIRDINKSDMGQCLNIYNHYVENSVATFEESALNSIDYERRIERITAEYPFLVAVQNDKIKGFAYLDKFNERSAYRYTADLSVYVDKDNLRSGIGTLLLAELEKKAKEKGIKQIISIITATNESSRCFHAKNGFIFCGKLPDVGFKFNHWLGIEYYIKNIESCCL